MFFNRWKKVLEPRLSVRSVWLSKKIVKSSKIYLNQEQLLWLRILSHDSRWSNTSEWYSWFENFFFISSQFFYQCLFLFTGKISDKSRTWGISCWIEQLKNFFFDFRNFLVSIIKLHQINFEIFLITGWKMSDFEKKKPFFLWYLKIWKKNLNFPPKKIKNFS